MKKERPWDFSWKLWGHDHAMWFAPQISSSKQKWGEGELMLWSQTKRMCSLSSREMRLQEVHCFMLNGKTISLTIRITNVITLDQCLFSGLVNWASKWEKLQQSPFCKRLQFTGVGDGRVLFPSWQEGRIPSSEAFHECVSVCLYLRLRVSLSWGDRERKEGRKRERQSNQSVLFTLRELFLPRDEGAQVLFCNEACFGTPWTHLPSLISAKLTILQLVRVK